MNERERLLKIAATVEDTLSRNLKLLINERSTIVDGKLAVFVGDLEQMHAACAANIAQGFAGTREPEDEEAPTADPLVTMQNHKAFWSSVLG